MTRFAWARMAAVGLVLWGAGCAKAEAKDAANDDRHLPMYVDRLEAPATVKAGEPFTVAVVGSWPDPLWKTEKVLVSRDTKARRLRIVVRGVRESEGLAITMLQDARQEVSLPALAAGRWTLVAEGHADTQAEAQVEVR